MAGENNFVKTNLEKVGEANLGTVRKYLKFFSFSLRRKGGRGLRPGGKTKPEEKLEENRERGVLKIMFSSS